MSFLYPRAVGVALSSAHITVRQSLAGKTDEEKSLLMFYRDFIRGVEMMSREESNTAFGTSTLLDVNPF